MNYNQNNNYNTKPGEQDSAAEAILKSALEVIRNIGLDQCLKALGLDPLQKNRYTTKDIAKAFRDDAAKYHPNNTQNDPEKTDIFTKLSNIKDALNYYYNIEPELRPAFEWFAKTSFPKGENDTARTNDTTYSQNPKQQAPQKQHEDKQNQQTNSEYKSRERAQTQPSRAQDARPQSAAQSTSTKTNASQTKSTTKPQESSNKNTLDIELFAFELLIKTSGIPGMEARRYKDSYGREYISIQNVEFKECSRIVETIEKYLKDNLGEDIQSPENEVLRKELEQEKNTRTRRVRDGVVLRHGKLITPVEDFNFSSEFVHLLNKKTKEYIQRQDVTEMFIKLFSQDDLMSMMSNALNEVGIKNTLERNTNGGLETKIFLADYSEEYLNRYNLSYLIHNCKDKDGNLIIKQEHTKIVMNIITNNKEFRETALKNLNKGQKTENVQTKSQSNDEKTYKPHDANQPEKNETNTEPQPKNTDVKVEATEPERPSFQNIVNNFINQMKNYLSGERSNSEKMSTIKILKNLLQEVVALLANEKHMGEKWTNKAHTQEATDKQKAKDTTRGL